MSLPHETRPVQVWVDADLGIADLVVYLNTIPGVRTLSCCQGGVSYRPYVSTMADPAAYARLKREGFDITVLGDNWAHVHPKTT